MFLFAFLFQWRSIYVARLEAYEIVILDGVVSRRCIGRVIEGNRVRFFFSTVSWIRWTGVQGGLVDE